MARRVMGTLARWITALAILPISALFLVFLAIFVIGAVALFGAIIAGILFGTIG